MVQLVGVAHGCDDIMEVQKSKVSQERCWRAYRLSYNNDVSKTAEPQSGIV
jgi:hypothetical protein